MSGDKHFNADRVFVILFILTAIEVAFGILGGRAYLNFPKAIFWGGLIGIAIWKGLLIAWYFMHLKFEGWIVKGLILPTPFLIMVIFGYVIPDVADEESNLVHPVGSQLEHTSGAVYEHMADREAALGGGHGGGH